MTERIHDDEPDTSEPVVRTLLSVECPQWSDRPIEYLRTSGTDNAMWRVRTEIGPDVAVRLPRRPGAAAGIEREMETLQRIATSSLGSLVSTPRVRHVGEPHEAFPHRWAVLDWIDGTDAWTARNEMTAPGLADDLAAAVNAIGSVIDVPAPTRRDGSRGGPIGPLVEQLFAWLDDPQWGASDVVDVRGIRRLADEALEIADEPVTHGFVHGDLIPGNLLLDGSRLTAIIDWGGTGWADPAQDLAPAWSVLTGADRARFMRLVSVDEAAWIRGRTNELEHAVGGVLYYVPRRHPLGDVMSRTLARILESP